MLHESLPVSFPSLLVLNVKSVLSMKLAKYESRVPFELGRCLDEVDTSAFSAEVKTVLKLV